MTKNYRARLIQDGVIMAQVDGASSADVEKEIRHYNWIYAQDGPVEIVRNYPIPEDELPPVVSGPRDLQELTWVVFQLGLSKLPPNEGIKTLDNGLKAC